MPLTDTIPLIGSPLTAADIAAHARLGIDPSLLDTAGVRRVTDRQAREDCGLTYRATDLSGVCYPRIDPWSGHAVSYRVRRDHPDMRDGRPDAKYISSPDRQHPYLVPGTTPHMLADVTIPIGLVEAEKSALAITSAAQRGGRAIIAIGLGGCWGWWGRVGRTEAADGTRVDARGELPDWDRMTWTGRIVYVALDATIATSGSVQAARRRLVSALTARGADVRIVTIPPVDGINGPDDLIGTRGDAAWWALVDGAPPVAARDDRDGASRGPSQATQLVDLALASGVELWHTPTGDAYATVAVDGHREHHPLRRVVRDYLARTYYAQQRRSASSAALTDALGTLGGMARYDGPTSPTCVRVGHHAQTVYLDLGDADWRAVAIDADGWRIVAEAPVRCWRPASLRTLPMPVAGGSLDALRALWPVDEDTWTLIVSWLVAALSTGPYPILIETGEQGSGKSTLGRMVRGLIDPASPELRGVPRDERDVMIGALTSHVVALDNLSGLPAWLSDALCRIATGGGLATRTLYSDLDETLIDVMRPILLTGIEQPATRGDLLDRALVVTLPAMDDAARGDEADLWGRYEAMRPTLLGALLDAVSCALRRRAEVTLQRRPRMADACTWVTAAEPALGWPTGRTAQTWLGARDQASADLLSMDAVAQAIIAMTLPWDGTAADLLARLAESVSERVRTARTWPTSPRALSGALRRLAPDLRRAGIEVQEPRRQAGTGRRVLRIVTTVTPSQTPGDQAEIPTEGCDGRRDDTPRPSHPTVTPSQADLGLISASRDGRDGRDGPSPTLSSTDPAPSAEVSRERY